MRFHTETGEILFQHGELGGRWGIRMVSVGVMPGCLQGKQGHVPEFVGPGSL